ncbi:LLM class flavin-dependent oxidoreductase [Microbacterium sp. zg.Y625]|uniref:LLM class flavin-dependent oxidoreductase n=1 Tax=Microbacterium jiangjiandongii TaxID=3049071 RepID=UPI00214D1206|nr:MULTISPECIES: LLM class flavin-dependent oxidoreductase [unclassified Microbacterium]MCR2791814.1 LLM class flavin-dependent oxidoreductase [Microbacterium sp. zg.Y625]WIM24631.1 LLM class flavin-dependent oxidoreductase [Microbacterium sp. zg-Y625]
MSHDGVGVRIGVIARPQLPPEHLPAAARAAEAAGVDDLWLWEDSFWSGGLVTSAAALDATTTLRLGLGLMPVPLRNPALAAMEVAALSRLHPARFVPAFGHGVRAWMQQAGAAVDRPLTLLREYATAVRALLHGEEVTAAGQYVQLDGVRLSMPPAADAVPPILLGANGPKALALAGEIADGVVLGEAPTAGAVASAVQIVREPAPRHRSRRLPCTWSATSYASPDDEVVPFAHRDLYAAAIPRAVTRTVTGGHQLGDDLRVVADDIRGLVGDGIRR